MPKPAVSQMMNTLYKSLMAVLAAGVRGKQQLCYYSHRV